MPDELRSQIWKEWRERRQFFVLAAAWIACGSAYAVLYELSYGYRASVATFYSVCSLYGLVASLFLAARASRGEVTYGTLAFTAALPSSLRRAAAIRLGGAIITLCAPMLLGAVLMSVALGTGLVEQAPARPHENYVPLPQRPSLTPNDAVGLLWTVTAVSAVQSIGLLCLLSVIGVRRRSEAVVAFIGAPIAMLWLIGTGIRTGSAQTAGWANWLGALLPQSLIVNYGYGDDVGSYGDLDVAPLVWGPLATHTVLLIGLGVWFANRYGDRSKATPQESGWRRLRLPPLVSRIPMPVPGQLAALIWVNVRQSVPLAAAGLALAGLMTMAMLLIEGRYRGAFVGSVAGQLPGSAWIIGTLWAAVVAAGVFGPELQPRLEAFWRSRPISPTRWFWVKYVVGLVAVLGVLDGVTILVSWDSSYATEPNWMTFAYVACMPLIHATVYSLTTLAVIGLRRPAVGAMAAIVVFFVAMMAAESIPGLRQFEPIGVHNILLRSELDGELNLLDHRYLTTYTALAVFSVAAAVAAWRVVLSPASGFRPIRREAVPRVTVG